MHLFADDAQPLLDQELNERLADRVTFESTVKSFEILARNLTRGFKVNQAINALRSSGSSDGLTSSNTARNRS